MKAETARRIAMSQNEDYFAIIAKIKDAAEQGNFSVEVYEMTTFVNKTLVKDGFDVLYYAKNNSYIIIW